MEAAQVQDEQEAADHVRVRNCCFATESRCPARVREIQFQDGAKEWVLERYGVAHFDHSVSLRISGVKLSTALMLRSLSNVVLSNQEALKAVRRQEGAVSEQAVKSIIEKRKRIRREEQLCGCAMTGVKLSTALMVQSTSVLVCPCWEMV